MDRVFWIDLIRVAGAFFVVMIHVCARVAGGRVVEESGRIEAVGSPGWLTAQCISNLSSIAVPLFLMVSGALLLGRNVEMIPFYRKRFGKILLPFLAWSCIFLLCLYLAGQTLKNGTPITLTSAIGAILSGTVSGHFWFMYTLIALYLVTPFLSVFVRNASKNMLTGFLILWFFAAIIFPVINSIAQSALDITNIAAYAPFERGTVSYSVGFFIAGYILKDVLISKRWAVIGIVIALTLAAAAPVNAYLRNTYPDSSMSFLLLFMGRYILPIVSHTVTLSWIAFLVLRSLGNISSPASSRFGRLVILLAPLTFGIFLCHHLFLTPGMKILDNILGLGTCESWVIILCAVPTLAALFYCVSAGLVYLLRWSRYLKFLAP